MTQSDFKNQVDNLMNILWGAGVASHATIIEQINYLVFLRSLSKKDDNAMILDSSAERIFNGELKKYHWDNLIILNTDELFNSLEEVFRKLPELTSDQTIKLLFRDAHVKIFDKPTLRRLVHEIEKMFSDLEKQSTLGHTDIFGDMYEYLLSKLSQAGTLGSFRTPRHIIKFIVDIIDPKKGETILDPACGTAGFLVAALKHLEEKYTSEDFKKMDKYPMDLLSPQERDFVYRHTFTGFDSDFDMFKFGLMNLYLHKLEHPNIKRQNTLVDTAGDRTKWDVILANPPFSGALDKDSISEDVRMNTSATEVLFLRYMIDHLSSNGRAGVIVPEGIIFNESGAYNKIRKMLIEESGLWCVVSLPPGIFNPYAIAQTSILFYDKTLKNKNKSILFIKVSGDGYDLGLQRNPNNINDLPESKEVIINFLNSLKNDNKFEIPSDIKIKTNIIKTSEILKEKSNNLSIDRYIDDTENFSKWESVPLSEILEEEKFETKIQDEILYKQVKVKMNGKGLETRCFKKGKQIGTKHQFILKNGQFVLSKIDARNGAFGIVPSELEGAIVTQDFPSFKIKHERVLSSFIEWIIKSKKFIDICNNSSLGTTNRRRLKVQLFLNKKIPLPPIDIQKTIMKELEKYQKENEVLKSKIEKNNEIIKSTIEGVWNE